MSKEKQGPLADPIKRVQSDQLEQTKTNPTVQGNNEAYPDEESEYVPLPSKGIFYKGMYKDLDKLRVRKLNWTDEDILTTKSYYDNGTLFSEILKGVIVDSNGFKEDQLVPVDRDAILMWLRIGAFGKDYSVPHECTNPDCKAKQTRTWDLADFDMPKVNPDYEKELRENGEVVIQLPESKETIKITVPSVGRELQIKKMLEEQKRKLRTERDFLMSGKILSIVSEVKGADDQPLRKPQEIHNYLKHNPRSKKPLGMVDSRFIQKKAKEINVQIDTKKDFICKKCGHSEEGVEMPMSIYFFWPEYEAIS